MGTVSIQSLIYLQLDRIICIFSYTFSIKMFLFPSSDLASKPTESLEQIATFDVKELLSKSAVLSENVFLQLRQSLTKEWGEGFVSTLPEDFVQNLLTEVSFLGNHPHPSINHTALISFNVFCLSFLLLVFFNFLKNIYYLYFLGLNPDRTSKPPRREGC